MLFPFSGADVRPETDGRSPDPVRRLGSGGADWQESELAELGCPPDRAKPGRLRILKFVPAASNAANGTDFRPLNPNSVKPTPAEFRTTPGAEKPIRKASPSPVLPEIVFHVF